MDKLENEIIDFECEDVNTPFEDRMYEIAKGTLPHTIDRTPNGEFVIDNTSYGETAYFENEDCVLMFSQEDGDMKAYYYSDADVEYYFDINVNEKMTDDEIKKNIIKGFSNKFGWLENYDINSDYVDDEYLAIITIDDGEEHIIDLGVEQCS